MPKEIKDDVVAKPITVPDPATAAPAGIEPDAETAASSPFQKMVSKVEAGMKEWEESRYKPIQTRPEPEPPTPPKEPEKPKVEPKPAEPTKTAKPEEKPATEPAIDEDEPVPSVIKSQKAADEFRNLRRQLKAQIKAKEMAILGLKKKVEDTEQTKTAAAMVPQPDAEELAKLKSEREQLINEIEKVKLEASPRFKARFDKSTTDIEAMARDAAGDHAEEAIALMKMPPSKFRKERLNHIVGELQPADQSALVLAFARMDLARSERDEALNNHREYIKQLQAEELVKQEEQQVLARAKRDLILKQALEVANDFEVFKPKQDDPEHNAEAEEYKREVAAFINGEIDEAHSAFLPILAAEGQYLKAKKVPALEAKIKELEEVITELKGANPNLEGTKTKESDRATKKQKGFAEAFQEHWKGPNPFGA